MSTCYCENCIGTERTERLHEAAADMLEALEAIMRAADNGRSLPLKKAEQAIRKAKGE